MLKKSLCVILSTILSMSMVVPVYAENAEVTVNSGANESCNDIITNKEKGAKVTATDDTNSSLSVNNNVEVNYSGNDNSAIGIEVRAGARGSADVNVGGSIKTEATDAKGIGVLATGNSTVNVNVEGDIVTNGLEASSGVLDISASGSDTMVNVRVGGDIKGNGSYSSSVEVASSSGAIVNIVAEGTLSAGSDSVVAFSGNTDNISLVIWKADTNSDTSLVKELVNNGGDTELQATQSARTLEQSIHYILKVDTSQDINLSGTTEETYIAPDGTTKMYNTAKEGDQVAVRLNIPVGYDLIGAFSDKERTCNLLQDNSGDYYLVVPKGGGIYVNMWLVKKSAHNDNEDPQPKDQEAQKEQISGTQKKVSTVVNLDGHFVQISFPDNGERSFSLDYSSLQAYIKLGITDLKICNSYGYVSISINELLSYMQGEKTLTFVLDAEKQQISVEVDGKLQKTYSLISYDRLDTTLEKSSEGLKAKLNTALVQQIKTIEQKNNELSNKSDELSKRNEALSSQLATAQKNYNDSNRKKEKYEEKYKNATNSSSSSSRPENSSRAQALSKNNAIGDGYGGYIAQGGHVQIDGGKSNVTFTLSIPSKAIINSASSYASSIEGTLLYCVSTSSPGVTFKNAIVNFSITGVPANDSILAFQLQGKNWVPVRVVSVTNNHVNVELAQHGPLAFVRTAAIANEQH